MNHDEFRKVDAWTAGLNAFDVTCENCHKIYTLVEPKNDHPHLPMGIACMCCRQKVWANSRCGALKKTWIDQEDDEVRIAKKNLNTYRTWLEKIYREFFESLPNCPNCGKHEYEFFNPSKPDPCPHCGIAGEFAEVRDVSGLHYADDVWWFGPLRIT